MDRRKKLQPKNYIENWHIDQLDRCLEISYEKRIWFVLECMVRGAKSENSNVYGPASRLCVCPTETFQLTTATQNLSDKFAGSCLSAIGRCGLPFKFKETGRAQWKIDTAGIGENDSTYFASGIDGTRQGRGASVSIIDDIYKTGFQSKQQATREKYQDTIQNSVINRLTPDGVCHFLGARIHPMDIIGWVLEMEAEGTIPPVLHLRLPATNDSGKDSFFRYGEDIEYFPAYDALWPKRYDRKKLDQIRLAVSEAWWQSQYQQSPNLAGNVYFHIDKAPRYDHPRVVRCWHAWDLAQTATLAGSYSAGCGIGQMADGRLALLWATRGRWRQEQMEEEIVKFHWNLQRLTGLRPEACVIERAAAGFGVGERLQGSLPVEWANPHGTSKEDRAGSVASIVNRGLLLLPPESVYPWQQWAEEDIKSYPMVKSSDFIDSFVYALAWGSMAGFFKAREDVNVGSVDLLEELGLSGGQNSLDDFFRDEPKGPNEW